MLNSPPPVAPRSRRALLGLGAVILLLALMLASAALLLRASLPVLEGQQPALGLRQAGLALRDDAGVPSILAADREDAGYVLGFLHAQDRFFQMDLLRRSSAGELAALLGPTAIEQDLSSRRFLFRRLAQDTLPTLPPAQRRLLTHYTQGVNAGLAALNVRPFEYLLLGQAPAPWREEDALLVIWTMYQRLQGHIESRELARRWLRMHSSPDVFAAMLPTTSRYDAPLDAPPGAQAPGSTPGALPALPAAAPDWVSAPAASSVRASASALRGTVGSNAWVIGGARSAHGGALLANDMHLPLSLPNTWYRAQLTYPVNGVDRRVVGLTLPGAPLVVAGSNGAMAWGFTNGFADTLDLVEATADAAQPGRFLIGGQSEDVPVIEETLAVRGEAPRTLQIRMSKQGPLIQVEGQWLAVDWTARSPGAVNLGLLALETADHVHDAVAMAPSFGIPTQNLVLADREGRIGWTLAGPLPRRSASVDPMKDDGTGWAGLLPGADYPSVEDPPDQQLWSANSRQFAGPRQALIGDGGADLGARATQLRDLLSAQPRHDETSLSKAMLDDRALFMSTWRAHALRALSEAALKEQPARQELRGLLQTAWSGRADQASVGYTLSRSYLNALYMELFGAADESLSRLPGAPDFATANPRWPVVIDRLITERPPGWLRGRTWEQVELAALDRAIARQTEANGSLAQARWGSFNATSIAHPLAGLPLVGRLLQAPPSPQSGDEHMPRVSAPDFGQSERLVVAPGREEQALFNMPGGQSGHPWSPFFLADHQAWIDGVPGRLLPGPERHRLLLTPP